MPDLTTTFMGLRLRNPLIISSSDLTDSVERVARCEEAGAGAVVLKSIFEEQFWKEGTGAAEGSTGYPEALDYLREVGLLEYAAQRKCRIIEEAKKKVSIPIVASINCQSLELWPSYARQFQEAGADALELNIYFLPISPDKSSEEYEKAHLHILKEVTKSVVIPVSVKLSSQFTALPHVASRLADAGCQGLVLFNWFMEPDINVKTLEARNIIGKGSFGQTLKWVGLLAGRVGCDIAASGGVRAAEDVVKQLLAGASAVEAATLFYQKSLKAVKEITGGLAQWMKEHKFEKVGDFRGELSLKNQLKSSPHFKSAEAFLRTQYLKTFLKKDERRT